MEIKLVRDSLWANLYVAFEEKSVTSSNRLKSYFLDDQIEEFHQNFVSDGTEEVEIFWTTPFYEFVHGNSN